jgi:ATP-binding cassette subfamily F protein uup
MSLLTCLDLSKTYGTRRLFEGVAISIDEGERLGLIGPNGSGKSTLLKIMAGLEPPDTGTLTARRNLRVAYVPQRDQFPEGATAMAVVLSAVCGEMHDDHERESRAVDALAAVGFTDLSHKADALSGGWRKRLAIARELVREPDVLLMDEPTNHLDLEGILWLEEMLQDAAFASVVVTHDRYFLESAATRIVELSQAYPQGTFSVEGAYGDFLQKRAEFLIAQAQQQASLANKVREDLRWLGRGAQARRTKSKSRIYASYDRMDELADLKSRNAPAKAAAIEFTATNRQTRKLLAAVGVAKSLGGKPLFKNLDLELAPGMRLGLLGPNGSGKTSLIRVLTGELPPDSGSVKRADNLRIVTFTQRREELDPRESLREAIAPGSDFVIYQNSQVHVNTWASRFLFRTDQYNTSVGDLSGGEQARILIARLMLKPADLLILDEPTNDLDIASLEVLEESLAEFPGAVLLVTHDRFMLDRLSTDILGLDGKGGAKMYADYPQWQKMQDQREVEERAAAKSKTAPAAAAAPTAVKTKLSYKDQRELDSMESNINAAEAEVKKLDAKMHDPALVADHKKMQEFYRQLEMAHMRVTQLYARWAELEAK